MMRVRIEGMTCGHCARSVARALEGVRGVERVAEIDLTRGEALIVGSPDRAAVVAAVTHEGYRAFFADAPAEAR